jgi:putative protease
MCRNTVFTAAAQSAAAAVPRLRAAGVRRFRLEFVWERGEQVVDVLNAWRALVGGRASPSEVLAVSSAREQFGVTAGTMRTLHPGVGPKAGGGRAAPSRPRSLARAREGGE